MKTPHKSSANDGLVTNNLEIFSYFKQMALGLNAATASMTKIHYESLI